MSKIKDFFGPASGPIAPINLWGHEKHSEGTKIESSAGMAPRLALLTSLILSFAPFVKASDATSRRYFSEQQISDLYTDKVQPILVGRCVVCHSCTEAPCQLKMSSFDALERGLSLENLDGAHIKTFLPSRMKDANSESEWRQRGYSTVLTDSPLNSIFSEALNQGRNTGTPGFSLTALDTYRKENSAPSCPSTKQKHMQFLNQYPSAGMPLGLPALESNEYAVISDWLAQGAPGPSAEAQAKLTEIKNPQTINSWELFFNQRDAKSRLAARYIYEHVAQTHVNFSDRKEDFFELVCSRTQFPLEIQEIVTDLPSSSPGTTEFYYRFKKINEAIVKKTHIVWAIDAKEMNTLKALFASEPWQANDTDFNVYTQNPFRDFKSIPAKIRSLFMLTHSKLLIDQMVRGTVCVGNIASYAIRDHFWVSFLNPNSDPSVAYPMPISLDRTSIDQYQNDFEYYLQKMHPDGLGLNDIWQAQGDANSQLTILRHDATASVHTGWVGGSTKTGWVLSYSNFERLFYNVVVNFKYWGSLEHRAVTWEIMRLIRIEGEELFLTMLPTSKRWQVRNEWAEGSNRRLVKDHEKRSANRGSQISVTDNTNPVFDLQTQMIRNFAPVKQELDDRLNTKSSQARNNFEYGLKQLTKSKQPSFEQFFPSTMYVRLNDQSGRQKYYTLIINRAYSAHTMPLEISQRKAHVSDKDDLIAFEGLLSSHPHQIFDLQESQSSEFLNAMAQVRSEQDFIHFKTTYALQRNSPTFWTVFDQFVKAAYQADPVNAGLIDLNRYDNGLK